MISGKKKIKQVCIEHLSGQKGSSDSFGIRIWAPIPVHWYQNPAG